MCDLFLQFSKFIRYELSVFVGFYIRCSVTAGKCPLKWCRFTFLCDWQNQNWSLSFFLWLLIAHYGSAKAHGNDRHNCQRPSDCCHLQSHSPIIAATTTTTTIPTRTTTTHTITTSTTPTITTTATPTIATTNERVQHAIVTYFFGQQRVQHSTVTYFFFFFGQQRWRISVAEFF